MTAPGGEESDGCGTSGSVEEKTRQARAGETGTTRFGMEEGAGTEGEIDSPLDRRDGDEREGEKE